MKSCFMFGHADCPDAMLPQIVKAIEDHYEKYGVRVFYVGSRGRFDQLAAIAAKRVKERYTDLCLCLVLAYHPAERPVDPWDSFDRSYYPPLENVPRPYAIVRANQHMTDTVDTVICYVRHMGNSRNLLEYARRKKEIYIENVAEKFPQKDIGKM